MSDDDRTLPSTLRAAVKRDVWIICGTVVIVGAVVAWAVLLGQVGGLIGIAVATAIVGAVKQIGAVLERRYEQAVESLQVLLAPKDGRIQRALELLSLKREDAPEAAKIKSDAASLIAEFERRGALAAEWSAAAGLITWVLGLGTVLTAVLQLLAQ